MEAPHWSRSTFVQTIKTAIVVVLLLGVCYGAYVALNAPEPALPPELGLEDWSGDAPDVVMDASGSLVVDIPQLGAPGVADGGVFTPPNFAAATLPTLTPAAPSLSASPAPGGLAGVDGPSVALPPLGGGPNIELPKMELPTLEMPRSDAPGAPSAFAVGDAAGAPSVPLFPGLPAADGVAMPAAAGAAAGVPGTFVSAPSSRSGGEALAAPDFPAPDFSLPGESGSPLGSPADGSAGATTASANREAAVAGAQAALAATAPGNATSAVPLPKQPFAVARQQALKLAGEGKLREALVEMSLFYNSPEITHEEHLDLMDLLDALAAEVIYSKRHLLEPAYNVAPGDSLEALAARYKVTPELLARINGLGDSRIVLAGTQLKVLYGPFRSDVNLNRGELTLFLNDMYAGRFPISIGSDPAPHEGSFEVTDKRRDRTYYGAGGNVLKAEDPRNPYGGYWVSLGTELCIHGTPEMATPEVSKSGCISLAPLDARDVYMILAPGNRVTIHR
jgi:lipoprotein-anchoring transpeptidase ErfK/SrfK